MHTASAFMGPAIVAQARLFLEHPATVDETTFRKEMILQNGGVSGCGKSLNCGELCPKKIPLVDSIAAVNGIVTKYVFSRFTQI